MIFLGRIGDSDQAQLGQIHQSLGDWVGAQALALLRKAMIEPADIDLVGCQAFLLPGGLALGDLAHASQASEMLAARAEAAAAHAQVGIAASGLGR